MIDHDSQVITELIVGKENYNDLEWHGIKNHKLTT